MLSPKGELKATLMLQNNIIECYNLKPSEQSPQVMQTSKINIGGHRTDVRTVSFSSDNIAILSAAAESVKIWNRYESFINGEGKRELHCLFTWIVKHLQV